MSSRKSKVEKEALRTSEAVAKTLQKPEEANEVNFRDDFEIVAAIDFGTSSSGFAYSSKLDYNSDPTNIHSIQLWNNEKHGVRDATKTATAILLDKDRQFVSFGYDAQSIYASKQLEKKDEEFALFLFFKMELYKSKVTFNQLKIEDVSKRVTVSAALLFILSIRALKDSVIKSIKESGKYDNLSEEKIRWVITIPAIWNQAAKFFMRDCAVQAGIPSNQLLLALEPEAASVYCSYIFEMDTTKSGFQISKEGTKYAVVDIGGGTTDITVHERLKDHTLQELNKSSGAGIGGKSVDDALITMVNKCLNETIVATLQKRKPHIYLDLRNDLEAAKIAMTTETRDEVSIPINYSVLNSICKELNNSTISKNITGTIEDDGLLVDYDYIKNSFTPTIESIIDTLKNALDFKRSDEVSTLILVGGFANCELLQVAIKENFRSRKYIVPDKCGSAVVRGAVLFGHNPSVINSRRTRYTYGIATNQQQTKMFDIIVQQNVSVPFGRMITRRYKVRADKRNLICNLYQTEQDSPEIIDSKCNKVGTLNMDLPETKDEFHTVQIGFQFGNTEIIVHAIELSEGNQVDVQITID